MQGLGLTLGDELTFEVGGFPLTATLTSVRRVEWDSLSPNFMLVLNPAALEDYPATFVASTYAPNREVMLEVVNGAAALEATLVARGYSPDWRINRTLTKLFFAASALSA